MKTFYDFIQEDFNSAGAIQFVLTTINNKKVTVFYEKLARRPFNLKRYLNTFKSSTAIKTLELNDDRFRGIIFCVGSNYHMFIFKANILHSNVCHALSKSTEIDTKYPKINYYGIYNNIYELDFLDAIPNEWCFPFVYEEGHIITNLYVQVFDKLFEQKDLEKEFMIDRDAIQAN